MQTDPKIAIQGLTPAALVDVMTALSLTGARKIVGTVARGGAIDGPCAPCAGNLRPGSAPLTRLSSSGDVITLCSP